MGSHMDIQLNTLYVLTTGSYIHRDHRNVVVEFEKKVKASIPIHHLDSVAIFGPSMVSPARWSSATNKASA